MVTITTWIIFSEGFARIHAWLGTVGIFKTWREVFTCFLKQLLQNSGSQGVHRWVKNHHLVKQSPPSLMVFFKFQVEFM